MSGVSEKVQAISEATGRGQHTTTTSALYRLPLGGEVIDSPGVRSFGLWGIEADGLRDYFHFVSLPITSRTVGSATVSMYPSHAVRFVQLSMLNRSIQRAISRI